MNLRLVLILASTIAIFTANTVADLEISSRGFHFIGTADGKSFFFDNGEGHYKGWVAAADYCAQVGMHLASLDTKAQYDLINNHNDYEFISSRYFWTAGRDSQDLSQLKWHDTNTSAMTATYIEVTPKLEYYLSCLRLAKYSSGLEFNIVGCEIELNYPLCEM